MRCTVSGRHIQVGDALRSHVEDHINETVEKYAERPTEANVVFAKEAHAYLCEVIIHLSTGLTAQAKSSDAQIYASFEKCLEKMEKQLRRYKRRLKNHHKERKAPIESVEASSYIVAASDGAEGPEEPESLQPVIVAEIETRVPTLTAGEAVMQMELAESAVLVFRNQAHGGINVVYRRDDGNFGWIDPREQPGDT